MYLWVNKTKRVGGASVTLYADLWQILLYFYHLHRVLREFRNYWMLLKKTFLLTSGRLPPWFSRPQLVYVYYQEKRLRSYCKRWSYPFTPGGGGAAEVHSLWYLETPNIQPLSKQSDGLCRSFLRRKTHQNVNSITFSSLCFLEWICCVITATLF